ncbi:MAG: MFS transporter [Acidothermaceae bacterium]
MDSISANRAASRAPHLTLRSKQGRWVLLATIVASGVAQLDATVVNVALPRIGADLHVGLTSLQWTVNAYTLTLSGLLLLGGSLGDRLGRRRMFVVGVVWFTAASIGCAIAPDAGVLIAMRAVQGVGSALLTPGSLAILQAVFRPSDRAPAVGAWSGLSGIASALGPVVGGVLVGAAAWGWRLVFLLNVPLAALVIVASRHIPETRDDNATGKLDVAGAVAAASGLAAFVYGLTEGSGHGWHIGALAATVAGAVVLVGFFVLEVRRARNRPPMLPPRLFRSRQFSAANAVTVVVYGAVGAMLFLLPVELQQGAGFSPVAAGASVLPVTIMLMLLSTRTGRLAAKHGPRWLMTIGPVVAGLGLMLLVRVQPDSNYVADVLPGIVVFGLGMATTVAPLTATVMAAVPPNDVGVGSAVNNDVARTAGLLAVAVFPALAGISSQAYHNADALTHGFHHAVLIAGALCIVGGIISAFFISDDIGSDDEKPVPRTAEPVTGG